MIIDNSQPVTENVGIRMYSSLMQNFNISTPILVISSTPGSESSPLSSVPFHTMYLDDPWTLRSPSTLNEDSRTTRIEIPLSVAETTYQATLDNYIDPGPFSSQMEEEDILALPASAVLSPCSHDFLNDIFPSD